MLLLVAEIHLIIALLYGSSDNSTLLCTRTYPTTLPNNLGSLHNEIAKRHAPDVGDLDVFTPPPEHHRRDCTSHGDNMRRESYRR